jgi:hypothetical protein
MCYYACQIKNDEMRVGGGHITRMAELRNACNI